MILYKKKKVRCKSNYYIYHLIVMDNTRVRSKYNLLYILILTPKFEDNLGNSNYIYKF